MKKLLFTLLSLLLYFSSFAQFFQSIFGNETTQWIMPNYYVVFEQGEWKVMDTISIVGIEGEYKILEYKTPINGGENGSFGKIRANETNSKLYFIEQNFTTEILIMDLDLVVGDKFVLIFRLFNQDIEEKIFVDSVYVFDGKKHVRFDDNIGDALSGETKRMFIEGIGPNWGFTPYGLLACKYDDFVLIYSFENEYIKDCSFKNMSVDNYTHEDNVKIYPNPTISEIQFQILCMHPLLL